MIRKDERPVRSQSSRFLEVETVPKRRPRPWIFAGLIVLSVAGSRTAQACPNCKEALSLQPEDAARMSSGFNWSVMFMLAVPASILSTGALMVHRAVKKGVFPEI